MSRASIAFVVVTLVLCVRPGAARTGEVENLPPARRFTAKEITEEGRQAIQRGLAWLARNQQPNGSWKANVGYKLNEGYIITEQDTGHVGVTALAGMAFLAGGHIPGRGVYGEKVSAAVRFVLDCVNSDGMITANESRMYSHAFGTLFLAEVYGMTRDTDVRKALQDAAQFTWKCQNQSGGWRYAPYAQDSDMSITVCQVMALRAARNVGIDVPKRSIDRAVDYVLESANTQGGEYPGSFKYQYRRNDPIPTRNSFALTAAGLATLFMAGLYTDEDILEHVREHRLERYTRSRRVPRIDDIVDYLLTRYGTTRRKHYFFYYGNYYAVQAMFTVGGEQWESYFARVQADLVRDQNRKDGSWSVERVGDAYATASACVILQVPYRYLPIFER